MDHEGKAPQQRISTSPKELSKESAKTQTNGTVGSASSGKTDKNGAKHKPARKLRINNLRKVREEHCLSQAELARRANLSALTIARIEKGFGCRMSTKRKILEALGLSLADRVRVFGEEE